MKNLIYIILVISVLIISFIVYAFITPSVIQTEEKFGQINFKSLSGEYDLYWNNQYIGSVNEGENKTFFKLRAGTFALKVIRKSPIKDFFYEFNKNLTLLPNSEMVMEWEAGPTIESSSGVLKYFVQSAKPNIIINTYPNEASVYLDDQLVDKILPIENIKKEAIWLKVKYKEGVEEKTVLINTKFNGNISMIVEVYLYIQPFV
ncbi:MAG: hypothetical protein N3A71_01910 [Candidatus Dojkabacteria bacterium]|nr:hypothetical protein [Candidatus Dojkabacteria bacterium]